MEEVLAARQRYPPHSIRRARALHDLIFWSSMGVLAAAGTLIVLLIAAFLLREGLPLIARDGLLRFLTDSGWWPRDGSFNMLPMMLASLLLTIGALTLATPFSLAFAIHTTFRGPPAFVSALRALVEASAAVPTVVYGLWGVTTIVPLINMIAPPGASLLAGILVVALMIFPTITILVQAALQAVPAGHIQAASALGVSQSQILLRIVLPAARHGILSAMVLGAARAIGETMVVLMVCGNIVQIPTSLLQPVRTLTANIALEMPYAMGDHRASLFVVGLLTLLLVSGMVAVGEWVGTRGRVSSR